MNKLSTRSAKKLYNEGLISYNDYSSICICAPIKADWAETAIEVMGMIVSSVVLGAAIVGLLIRQYTARSVDWYNIAMIAGLIVVVSIFAARAVYARSK